MLDDGEVERRVRLLRPMEHPAMPLAMMPQTYWREADLETFARAWAAEVAEVPAFIDCFAFELRNIVRRQPLPGYRVAIQEKLGGRSLLTFKPIAADPAKTPIARCQLPTPAVGKL